MISKEEWSEWKSSLVTKEFFNAVNQRREENKEALAVRVIEGQDYACWYGGYIQALQDVMNTDLGEINDED